MVLQSTQSHIGCARGGVGIGRGYVRAVETPVDLKSEIEGIDVLVVECNVQSKGGKCIKGAYHKSGEHHSKLVYKKRADGGAPDITIYYWDIRDGPQFSGWWIG